MTEQKVTVNQLDYERANLLLNVQEKTVPNGSALSALASEAMTELREINEKAQENITKRAEAEAKKAQEEAQEQAEAAKKLEGDKTQEEDTKWAEEARKKEEEKKTATGAPPKGPPTPVMGGTPAPKKG